MKKLIYSNAVSCANLRYQRYTRKYPALFNAVKTLLRPEYTSDVFIGGSALAKNLIIKIDKPNGAGELPIDATDAQRSDYAKNRTFSIAAGLFADNALDWDSIVFASGDGVTSIKNFGVQISINEEPVVLPIAFSLLDDDVEATQQISPPITVRPPTSENTKNITSTSTEDNIITDDSEINSASGRGNMDGNMSIVNLYTPQTIILKIINPCQDDDLCAGKYVLEANMGYNGKLSYHNTSQHRWLVFNGETWMITADNIRELRNHKTKTFGVFHFSSSHDPDANYPNSTWECYSVETAD